MTEYTVEQEHDLNINYSEQSERVIQRHQAKNGRHN